MSVVIETTVGDMTVDLFTEARPRTCMNFLKLCKMKYYNFNLMYSVQRNFIAQMGDPTSTGKGGSCIYEQMHGTQARFYEGEKLPLLKHTKLGTLSMVSCGNHLFGSQFFVTLGENLDSLDGEHLVFGEVVEGMEVLHKLNQVLSDEQHRPYQDIRISHTVVLDDPYPDPPQLAYPPQSPLPSEDVLASDYIAADEAVDDTQGKSMEDIQEEIQEREAKARATILEMVGDLPDSDMAPPENVLFVCKLNPVTTSEDLEIIFSRFGKIKSCEVIRDRISNNSLQYGFIEFAETKSCEDAYFKMDNVLIDDRRIHVDFSQSVSRIKWKGKGRGVEYFDTSGRKVEANRKDQSYNPGRDQQGGRHSNNTGAGPQRQGNHREMQRSQVQRGREAGSTNSHHKHKHRHEENNGRIERQQTGHKRKASQVEEEMDMSNNRDRKKVLKQLKKSLKKMKKKKKSKKYSSDSDESDSDSSEEEERKKKKNKKKKKKKVVSDSDSDSDSEPKKRSKKSKKKKKKKKRESSTSD